MELFDYQEKIVAKAMNHFRQPKLSIEDNKFNIFLQMGLGKTIIALEIAKRLNENKLLIVCPKSLIDMWVHNVCKYFPGITRVNSPEDLQNCGWKAFCVVNYEYFWRYEGDRLVPHICIFDEVHKIKNINSKLHKCIQRYIKPVYSLNLTGTPITKDYMDLFGILTCTGVPKFDIYNAVQFKSFFITNGGMRRSQLLMDKISSYSVFGDLEEYIDMPETDDVVLPVAISLEQQRDIASILNSKLTILEKISKCQQITSGISDKMSPKQRACVQLVDDIIADGQKVVLFCKFDKEYDFFMKYYSDVCVGINGKTKDRETPVYLFQNNPAIKVFVGNLQTAGVGITLTAANKCIFYSQTNNWADFEQAKARIYRIGQKNNCVYYHLLGMETPDEVIYQSNVYKTDLIEAFKKMYGGEECQNQ